VDFTGCLGEQEQAVDDQDQKPIRTGEYNERRPGFLSVGRQAGPGALNAVTVRSACAAGGSLDRSDLPPIVRVNVE